MKTSFWTAERRALLASLWERTPTREIAALLGCTGNMVIGKARTMGLPAIPREVRSARQRLGHRRRAGSSSTLGDQA